MKRLIDHYLRSWKNNSERMPLLIRGVRQVGKTYAVREHLTPLLKLILKSVNRLELCSKKIYFLKH